MSIIIKISEASTDNLDHLKVPQYPIPEESYHLMNNKSLSSHKNLEPVNGTCIYCWHLLEI